jgi:hypothetical protein
MKGSASGALQLSANHRRSISSVLQLVDKALGEWSGWIDAPPEAGVMYEQRDTLSLPQKKALRQRMTKTRAMILEMRDDLQLEPGKPAASRLIVGQATILWEMLAELNARSLQGYGEVPAALADYINPRGEALAAEMSEISLMFSKRRRAD